MRNKILTVWFPRKYRCVISFNNLCCVYDGRVFLFSFFFFLFKFAFVEINKLKHQRESVVLLSPFFPLAKITFYSFLQDDPSSSEIIIFITCRGCGVCIWFNIVRESISFINNVGFTFFLNYGTVKRIDFHAHFLIQISSKLQCRRIRS